MTEPMITIKLPQSHWNQIVDDIENWVGTHAEDIEILQQVQIIDKPEDIGCCE